MPTNKQAIDWITRTLALLAVFCVGTVCYLAAMGLQVPPELNTLTGGLVGSLASMLVKTTPTDTTPNDNAPDQPADKRVPVDPTSESEN